MSCSGHKARALTTEEQNKLEQEQSVSSFKQVKLEDEARKNWDLFYKRNTTHFFKDRHWLTREFPQLLEANNNSGSVLEVGCGVGNTVYPLLEECPSLFIHCCDISPRAVQFVKEHDSYSPDHINPFVCDLTVEPLSDHVPVASVDVVTLIFVLSAVCPEKMCHVLSNIFKILRPGGHVLFRDYGLYDYAMLRFKPGHKIQDQFYFRQDGTRAFYFSEEDVARLFSGYTTVSLSYEQRETVNKKEGVAAPRIFVQGVFTKPSQTSDNIL